jgi:hypothetical protein
MKNGVLVYQNRQNMAIFSISDATSSSASFYAAVNNKLFQIGDKPHNNEEP